MIFEASDYRGYLKEYLLKLPKQGFGEGKRMAKHLGVSSTFISQVLGGGKQLSLEQAQELSEYLGHSELEADYFFHLVQMDRAGTAKLKRLFQQKLLGDRG